MKKMITVVGGGSSAHLLIPLLSSQGHNVSLLTRRPEQWSKHISCEYIDHREIY